MAGEQQQMTTLHISGVERSDKVNSIATTN